MRRRARKRWTIIGASVAASLVVLACAAHAAPAPDPAEDRAADGVKLTTLPPFDGPRISLADAIRAALERNPQIRIQASQVAINKGLVQQANGAFDYTISALLEGTYGKADRQESVSYQAGVSKLLRNGITVGPLAEAEQQLSGDIEYTQTIVGLSVTIPLLQGRGTDVVTAAERSAMVQLEAEEYELRFVTARSSSR